MYSSQPHKICLFAWISELVKSSPIYQSSALHPQFFLPLIPHIQSTTKTGFSLFQTPVLLMLPLLPRKPHLSRGLSVCCSIFQAACLVLHIRWGLSFSNPDLFMNSCFKLVNGSPQSIIQVTTKLFTNLPQPTSFCFSSSCLGSVSWALLCTHCPLRMQFHCLVTSTLEPYAGIPPDSCKAYVFYRSASQT